MFSKILPVQSYIQPWRHKSHQIKRNIRKLLVDRSQTYILLSTRASCAGRNCQDNINTEMEIQRRWQKILQVKGTYLLSVHRQTYISYGQYVWSGRREVSVKSLIWTSRQQRRYTPGKGSALNYWPIAAEPTKFVAKLELSVCGEVKLIVSQLGVSLSFLESSYALNANWTGTYGLGKAGVVLSWLRGG